MSTLFPPSSESEALREQAQRDAQRQAPAFSPVLHSRIMDAIRQSESVPTDADQVVPRPRGPFGTIWTIAALAVLAVEVMVVMRDRPTEQASIVPTNLDQRQAVLAAEPLAEVSQVQAVPRQITLAMQTAASKEQWAGLDRDAKTVTKYLVDQVPFQSVWNNNKQE